MTTCAYYYHNRLFEQYPEISQDVCLYSQVCDLLAVYQYSMPRRLLIQSKFQDMTFDCVSGTEQWIALNC